MADYGSGPVGRGSSALRWVVAALVIVAAAWAVLAVLRGGGPLPGASSGAASTPPGPPDTVAGGPAPAASDEQGAPATFEPCGAPGAAAESTSLDPVAAIDATNDRWPDGEEIPHGTVVVQAAGSLDLTTGRLAAGNGYEASTGGYYGEGLVVGDGPVTAPVTLAILDSPQTGLRVAFVEVRLRPGVPARWEGQSSLTIVTDGGDGGVGDPDSPAWGDSQADDYLAAFADDGSNVCLRKLDEQGRLAAVLFTTGYGDGAYPTFVGYDADGRAVSAVHTGFVLPWSMSGLPGTPPSGVDDAG